jgi:hypothetical protein
MAFAKKRFTIGTLTVIFHGVVHESRWVRRMDGARGYEYNVEVEDLVGSAREGDITLSAVGHSKRVRFDPATLQIRRFVTRKEVVAAPIASLSSAAAGNQEIDVDVSVTYPAQVSRGVGRNRVYVLP